MVKYIFTFTLVASPANGDSSYILHRLIPYFNITFLCFGFGNGSSFRIMRNNLNSFLINNIIIISRWANCINHRSPRSR